MKVEVMLGILKDYRQEITFIDVKCVKMKSLCIVIPRMRGDQGGQEGKEEKIDEEGKER